MSDDARETAQSLSEGINCVAEIVETLKTNAATPQPNWPATLEAMERAFTAIRAKDVMTSQVLTDEQDERTHRLRLAVLRWQDTGQPPQELRALAEGFLRSFNL